MCRAALSPLRRMRPSMPEPEATAFPGRNRLRGGGQTQPDRGEDARARIRILNSRSRRKAVRVVWGHLHGHRGGQDDGQRVFGAKMAEGQREAAGGHSEQRERATSARPPPCIRSVQRGCPPTAAQPEAESAAPPQRGEHKRRGPAPHLAATDVQEGAESASGGLGRPRAVRVFEDKHAA
jgi:hypothetical protein